MKQVAFFCLIQNLRSGLVGSVRQPNSSSVFGPWGHFIPFF